MLAVLQRQIIGARSEDGYVEGLEQGGSGLDRISGSRLVALVDLRWYGTARRNGGILLVLGIGAVW